MSEQEEKNRQRLVERIIAMQALGLRRTDIKKILGVSYTAVHKFVRGDLKPAQAKLKEYNKRINSWRDQARRI